MSVVSNTGPLIVLAKLNRLDLLRELFGEVFIPAEVYRELTAKPSPESNRIEAAIGRFIHVNAPLPLSPVLSQFVDQIDEGEQHAINLALCRHTLLLMDDGRGRRAATTCNVKLAGFGGLLRMAKEAGLVSEIGPLLREARSAGYWIDDELIEELLRASGES